MQALKNMEPLFVLVITITIIATSIICCLDKKFYQIPVVIFTGAMLMGIACNPTILQNLGDITIKYICNILDVKGVV